MKPDQKAAEGISEFLTLQDSLAQAFLGTLRVARVVRPFESEFTEQELEMLADFWSRF